MNNQVRDITTLPLDKLTKEEWEQLCDHCGKCCLLKLEDMDDGRVYLTDVVCKEYDMTSLSCSCYSERLQTVPGCVKVSLEDKEIFRDLPMTCAYRLRYENKPLYDWHPLLSNTTGSVERAGISIKDKAYSEEFIHPDDFAEHIIEEIV